MFYTFLSKFIAIFIEVVIHRKTGWLWNNIHCPHSAVPNIQVICRPLLLRKEHLLHRQFEYDFILGNLSFYPIYI